jgi:spermidine synthase
MKNLQKQTESASVQGERRYLPLLLLLFAGSGCSALIYEIVWFQALQLVIGSTAVSLGVLLGVFMGGMCLGSLALPRFVSPRFHPLRVYALIELALGFAGIAVLHGIPYLNLVYAENAVHGFPGMLLRGAVCAVCLLPPTMLMGATLPAIARWIESTPQGVAWLGLFYGGNIAGAVFGCLLAGFYLLREHDLAIATYVAVILNAAVSLLSFALASVTRHRAPTISSAASPSEAKRHNWVVYVVIMLSGASALAAEVIWTRLLSLMLGPTVYTFSIILAVFLVGLGIGSSIGSMLARLSTQPRILLGWCQLLLAAAIAWTAYALTQSIPNWPINPHLSTSPWFLFQLDLARCLWAILPATCLWGASFPLALAAAATPGRDPGKLVGRVYAANTVGAILGAIGASWFLIPAMGSQNAQRALIALSAAGSLFLLASTLWATRRIAPLGDNAGTMPQMASALLGMAFIALLAPILVWSVPELPWQIVAWGRDLSITTTGSTKVHYLGEGMNASVAVTETDGARNFHVSGKVEASSHPRDMRLQRMLGHIPALLHPKPRSVLVVGFGAGVTAGSFLVHPDVEKIVICEIEPLIPQEIGPHFVNENYDVVHDPRVEIVYDDARHYILTTPNKFDIITSDPIHPWVKGSATLYTTEYFELCKRRLNPGGLITQWVPLYESSVDVVKSEIATFFEVFPKGTIWSNDINGDGYDLVLLGQSEELKIDADALHERFNRPNHAAVAQSLEQVDFKTEIRLFKSYAGQACDLGPWLVNAQINRDRNLRLQYLAGFQLNTNVQWAIYDDMVGYRRFPENIFVGTGAFSLLARKAIEETVSTHRNGEQNE